MIHLDENRLRDEDTLIEAPDYSVTAHTPFDPAPGEEYDVTLAAHSTTGLNSTHTAPTTCQYHRYCNLLADVQQHQEN